MNGLRFQNDSAFWLFIFILFYICIFLFFFKKNKKKIDLHFGQRISPWLSQSIAKEKLYFKLILECLGMCFLILALARPQYGQSQQDIKSEGIELMILADVSESMLAEDIKPSRLELMKIELEKLVDKLPGHKMGLIAFAGSAALMSPLTSDPSALKMYFQTLDTNSVTTQGTNFQTALSYAQEAFEKGGITQSEATKATRVVLILSDGEDHDKNAIAEAKKLSESGVYILTVAYGTEKGAPIPTRDQLGNLTGNKKDQNGQVILSQVRGSFLKEIAQTAKGDFFTSQFGGDHINGIVAKINEYEKTQFATKKNIQYDEKFMLPLAIGILFILFSFMLSTRRSKMMSWKSEYEN